MKLNNTVLTLALVGVLALAALAGGLLPAGNPVHAADPSFTLVDDPNCDTGNRCIPENTPPGVNIGEPISATDADEGAIEYADTLTYSLSGTDADEFDIDASTGQLITKAPLDLENPTGGTAGDSVAYQVTVTVKDSSGTSVTQDVTITVTEVNEAPGELAAPTVVSTDSDSDAATYELKVIWYAPDDGGDGVVNYDVQHKKTTAPDFGTPVTITDTTATITGLEVDTAYHVRVRAKNGVDDGPWSPSSVGSTNKKDNDLPTFGPGAVTLNVVENADPGIVVGAPVNATDDDNVLPLSYQLDGPDKNSFDLQASTGQIRTKRGVVYDFEKKSTLNVTMIVSDGQGGTDAKAVTINVTDLPETPSKPDRPTVRATQGNSRSLEVSWKAPDNTGPAITGYDVRYGKDGDLTLLSPAPTGTGTTATIAPTDDDLSDGDDRLTPGTSYEVSVRAKSAEAPNGGEWSAAGTGRTSPGNKEPVFSDRDSLTETDPTTSRTVAENTRAGQSVGRAVGATDGNGDTRTYKLVAADVPDETDFNNFDINESTGQILTKEPLNHEASACGYVDTADPTTCTYTVKVGVWDGLDQHRNEEDTANVDDTITVTIAVSDVEESPAAPEVTVTSIADGTGLVVTWDEPVNRGPAITGYRLECTGTDVPDEQCPIDLVVTDVVTAGVGTHKITGLTANKSYRVRLRAKNDEGDGTWSSWVTQSTNKENNVLPSFTGQPDTMQVEEDAPSAQQPVTDTNGVVTNIVAVAGDSDSLTLSLDGPGKGSFTITNAGQIRTRSKLNHEDPDCGYDNTAGTTECSYKVRVKVSDGNGGSAFHSLTINVIDKDEPPEKPAAPRVTATAGSGWSLQVTWNAPRNDGSPITGYQIRYRETGDSDAEWQQWPPDDSNVTVRSVKIDTIDTSTTDTTQVHLEPSTQYEVQVRALNGEGDSTFGAAANWSTSGRGTTGKSNRRPAFESTASVVELEVEENTRSGQNVGSAVEAMDPDKNSLTYTLEGPGKDSFTITSGGQIRTRAPLNHEEREFYSLTVKVNDRQRQDNSIAAKSVTIEVTDRPEAPSAPGAPTVSGIPGSTDSVRVTWDEPANAGPAITHYRLQYAVSGNPGAVNPVDPPVGSADRSAVITGLTAGTRYNVQVRAHSAEGHSDWSRAGTGSPNPDQANRQPAFSTRSHTFNVAENTPPGADISSLIAALDPDGDTLTYSLEGVDADSFDIIATNGAGQIQTKAALNHEEKASYSVAVRVQDGRGGTDAVNVRITVTDVNGEAPDTPFAPAVTAISSTRLQVTWDAPENTGPPINDYDYRYRPVTETGWTEVTTTTITATTVTVDGLTPSTSYDVEVRATNAEGTSEWSNPGNGATNAPGANNPPVFSEGATATRTVSATSPSGTLIGDPIAATDADTADTVTYSLEGRDAPSFDIGETNGQLRTKSGITLIVGTTYTVTVIADDTKDTARITVEIEATAAPPNNPPVFADASVGRSIREGTPAGTDIGGPIRATDPDTGDTLTYTLEGTDAASFDIAASNGQIRTLAALDASTKSTYSVTVRATDSQGASDTIAVTITVTSVPTTQGCGTRGAVADRSNTGLVADCEALLKATATLEDGARILNWSVFRPINEWDGIRSDSLEGTPARVTRLYLHSMGLSGTIAPELGELSELKWLYLHNNDLTGEIPGELNNLSKLERLYVYRNELTGISSQLGSGMANLRRLFAHSNRISGSIPPSLGDMPRLDFVRLDRNNLTGSLPSQLGNLDRLRRLYVHEQQGWRASGGGLTGTIPSTFGNMTRLEYLVIHRNSLSGPIPSELANLSNLIWLGLYDNGFTGDIPEELGRLSNLERLYLHQNGLSGQIPASLSGLSSLTNLWLKNNSLSGTIPFVLGTLDLNRLRISGNAGLTGCVPPGLVPTLSVFDSAGRETPPSDDIAESGLQVCN